MVRARQVGDGLRRRLLHANEKLSSVRDSLAQARKGINPALRPCACSLAWSYFPPRAERNHLLKRRHNDLRGMISRCQWQYSSFLGALKLTHLAGLGNSGLANGIPCHWNIDQTTTYSILSSMQGSARDLEEEEQRSLELLQGINEARATLRPPVDRANVPRNSSNRAQRGVRATTASTAKAQAQSRHDVNRSGSYHGRQSIISNNPSTWREWT